jgi:hypothetical protein
MKQLKLIGAIALSLLALSCSKKESPVIPTQATTLNSQKHTEWMLGDPLVNGVYWFKNPNGNNTFQVGSGTVGALVQENTYIAYTNQQWEITNLGGYGFYKIINHYSGLAMAVVGSSKSPNAQIDQETYTGAANQVWLIQYLAYGQYEIWNANSGSGLALTIPGDVTTQFTDLTQATFAETNASQQWEPTLISSLGTNTTYYVSNTNGNDSNTGLDSLHAWKTLTHASAHTYAAGNWLLLRSGDTWTSQVLALQGSGTALNPIILSSYGQSARPIIQPKITDTACIYLKNVAGWQISNLDLSDARDGICANYDEVYNSDYLYIENCNIHDLANTYNSNPNLYNHFSEGVVIEGYAPAGGGDIVALSDFTMHDCTFTNCNAAFLCVGTPFYRCNGLFGFTAGDLVTLTNLTIQNCTATNCGQWGMSLGNCNNGTVTNFDFTNSGGVANQYGTAAIVCAGSENVVFNGCNITTVHRQGSDPDGDGFDFEGGIAPDAGLQRNITLENCTITTVDGAGILMYNNGGHPDSLCTTNNVTITNFGQNPSSVGGGVYFSTATSATVSNCTFNRNNSQAYTAGDLSHVTLTNDTYH